MSRSPTLAQLEERLLEQQRVFLAEADRLDPRTATEEEVRALDAKALPLQELTNQIRMLRPVSRLRSELAATRMLQHEAARSDAEREMYRKNADELEELLRMRLQARARKLRRGSVISGVVVLVALCAWLAAHHLA